MAKDNNIVVGIFLMLLLVGVVLLAKRPAEASTPLYLNRREVSSEPKFRLVETPEPKQSGKHYQNEEVWDIEWNDDGLPKRVTIHRDARQT